VLEKLKKHLSTLKRQGFIDTELYDSENEECNYLEQPAVAPIDQADIYVLLISPDFLDSRRCYEIEMQRALERWEAKEAALILVLLRSTHLEGTLLEGRKFLFNGKPLLHPSSDIDATLSQIVGHVVKIAKELMITKNSQVSPESSMPLKNIPYGSSPFFTDRDAILTSLRDYFTRQMIVHQTRVQALHGLVGVGKTQIAMNMLTVTRIPIRRYSGLRPPLAIFWTKTLFCSLSIFL
jgi:hypothetical protein